MWDTIIRWLAFAILLFFWLAARSVSSETSGSSVHNSFTSAGSNEGGGLSLDPMDIEEPANMAMWMELGEL